MNLGSWKRVMRKIVKNRQRTKSIFQNIFHLRLSARLQLKTIRIIAMTHNKNDYFWDGKIDGNIVSLCLNILHPTEAIVNKNEMSRQGILVEFSTMCGSSTTPINILASVKKTMTRKENDFMVDLIFCRFIWNLGIFGDTNPIGDY